MRNITVRFNINDKIWVMRHNEPVKATINAIRINLTEPDLVHKGDINYHTTDGYVYYEYECFDSINALLDNFKLKYGKNESRG